MFQKEYAILKQLLYKSKNAHHSTLYYRKLVHVYRLSRSLIEKSKAQLNHTPQFHEQAKKLQDELTAAYIAVSSNLGLGHYLGFTIVTLSILAKLFTASFSLLSPSNPNTSTSKSQVVTLPDSDSDEISDIFG
ncbi:hypothetical protein NEHOM01_0113 [Nematocida homosporus]|uniref:uncharacterized protein n=1 Tax=Nematocida homosporus TaxID=1912981 RepID=UPI0022203541|nr:uncharacterized protein NEHOM01_0113 [Nematocida homosporus]KAI5184368.1 hypothetical protein NEHOM01_0113 [Nematocida homosporus]